MYAGQSARDKAVIASLSLSPKECRSGLTQFPPRPPRRLTRDLEHQPGQGLALPLSAGTGDYDAADAVVYAEKYRNQQHLQEVRGWSQPPCLFGWRKFVDITGAQKLSAKWLTKWPNSSRRTYYRRPAYTQRSASAITRSWPNWRSIMPPSISRIWLRNGVIRISETAGNPRIWPILGYRYRTKVTHRWASSISHSGAPITITWLLAAARSCTPTAGASTAAFRKVKVTEIHR